MLKFTPYITVYNIWKVFFKIKSRSSQIPNFNMKPDGLLSDWTINWFPCPSAKRRTTSGFLHSADGPALGLYPTLAVTIPLASCKALIGPLNLWHLFNYVTIIMYVQDNYHAKTWKKHVHVYIMFFNTLKKAQNHTSF